LIKLKDNNTVFDIVGIDYVQLCPKCKQPTDLMLHLPTGDYYWVCQNVDEQEELGIFFFFKIFLYFLFFGGVFLPPKNKKYKKLC